MCSEICVENLSTTPSLHVCWLCLALEGFWPITLALNECVNECYLEECMEVEGFLFHFYFPP